MKKLLLLFYIIPFFVFSQTYDNLTSIIAPNSEQTANEYKKIKIKFDFITPSPVANYNPFGNSSYRVIIFELDSNGNEIALSPPTFGFGTQLFEYEYSNVVYTQGPFMNFNFNYSYSTNLIDINSIYPNHNSNKSYRAKLYYVTSFVGGNGGSTFIDSINLQSINIFQGLDSDGDSVPDLEDNCLNVSNSNQLDTDNDDIGDLCDNCPNISNSNQLDTDNDGLGNLCDLDDDNDGVLDVNDNCPLIPNPNQVDVCGDNDNDGILNSNDNCPNIANTNQVDKDGDGIGDACDSDRDGDGIPNSSDSCPNDVNSGNDTDGDGIDDVCDTVNNNSKPDFIITAFSIKIDGVVISTPNPLKIKNDKTHQFCVKIKNQGTGAGKPSVISLIMSNGTDLVNSSIIANLPYPTYNNELQPNQEVDVCIDQYFFQNYLGNPISAHKYLHSYVDYNNNEVELDETNNSAYASLIFTSSKKVKKEDLLFGKNNLIIDDKIIGYNISIYNILGQLIVKKEKIMNNEEESNLLRNLKTGVYIIKSTGKKTRKILVEN
tara:strand:+ start:1692 stop:3326 length:1635 start_codon:yes stop_codon:yes gene_type:complete